MKHLYLFYLCLAFAAGLGSFGIVSVLYLKTKEILLRYYLFFFSAFSLLTASMLWMSYMSANIPGFEKNRLELAGGLFGALAMFAMAVFMHFLVNVPRVRLRNALAGVISLGTVLLQPLSFSLSLQQALLAQLFRMSSYMLFGGMFLYVGILGLLRMKHIQEHARKSLTRLLLWTFLLLLPIFGFDFLILDDFFDRPPVFFPLLYAGISTLFLVRSIKFYGHSHEMPSEPSTQEKTLEDLFGQYTLSPREQDVARLLLEGRSNQEIGEALFISLSTVKTHVGNVYQKCGVKNRVEFLTFFQKARNPDST